jgi:hypothetical protein
VSDWVETEDSAPVEAPAPVSAPASTATAVAEPASDIVETGDPDTPLDDDGEPKVRDSKGRWRSRARSQDARPEDVPRIRELTKKLRTMEAEVAALKAPKTPAPEPVFALPTPPVPAKGDPEPTLEQFADRDDPYGAWQRALAKWDRQQEQLQAESGKQQEQFQQTTTEAEAYWAGVFDQHKQRLTALVAQRPEAATALQSVKIQPPPLLDRAIMLDTNSAEVALYLASHPDKLDELTLMTTSQPVTQQNVEIIRRRLQQMMTAVSSGSVASSPLFVPAPRPPNPLRTAPMTTGDPVPGDDASLESHERYFHQQRGRRR